MPPKRKPTAPANRVYKSSTPLQQSRFPLRSTSVKYGKQTSKRVPKQETLTQIGFVNLDSLIDEAGDELDIYKDETEPPKKKRRKTTGDAPSSSSKYHTQTLTQIGDWSLSTEAEDDTVYDVQSSSPRSKELRKQRASQVAKPPKPAIQRASRRKSAPKSVAPLQTPRKRSNREIPSSESPATPLSRTSSIKRFALEERSINIPIPFNVTPTGHSPSKLPKLLIEDTFESEDDMQQPHIKTPSKKSSPAKSVRWAEVDEVHQIGDSAPLTEGDTSTELVVFSSVPQHIDEIKDSEDEEEEEEDDYEASENVVYEGEQRGMQPETCYGEIGIETQRLLATQEPPVSSPFVEETQSLSQDMPEDLIEFKNHITASQILGEPSRTDLEEEKTQYMESQRLATQQVRSMAARTKESDVFVSIRSEDVSKIVERAKNHDFRIRDIHKSVARIWIYEMAPTSTLQYMAVVGSSKRPGEIENENGIGNTEFNAKECTTKEYNRGWFAWEILELYELSEPLPWETIEANEWMEDYPRKPTPVRPAILDQLMANLKPAVFTRSPLLPQLPSEASTDTQEAEEQLLSTMKQYTQAETVPDLTSSQSIKEEDVPELEHEDNRTHYPDGFQLDRFNDNHEDDETYHDDPSSRAAPFSISSSSQINSHDNSSSQHLPSLKPYRDLMAPPKPQSTQISHPTFSQAETVDLSQVQTPRHRHTSDIIFESPTRPLFSSTPLTLPTLPTPRERRDSRAESILPYSMNSSQLLTKSQMLPDSLLDDSVTRMPLCIQDSDEEDEL